MKQEAFSAASSVRRLPRAPVFAFCGVQPGASGTMGLVMPSETQ